MSVTKQGYIDIEIASRQFRLDGTVGDTIDVGFRSSDLEEGVKLGRLDDIIGDVVSALGIANKEDFETKLREAINSLSAVKPLQEIVQSLLAAVLYVTDLQITAAYNETEEKYKVSNAAFGFRVDLNAMPVGPLTLHGFGILFEYTAETGSAPSQGRLIERPGTVV